MSRPPPSAAPRGVYVTGTDTGIGKTYCSRAMLEALGEQHCVAGMKPVASGCERDADGRWVNEDALALRAASTQSLPYEWINPFALPMPSAPDIAARAAGIEVCAEPIRRAFLRLAEHADWLLVEGVGGWLAPLGPRLWQSDLAHQLRLPVLLVVGLRLGCLNHALLSERAIRADGHRLLGWVGSTLDPDWDQQDDYLALLRSRIAAPCLGVIGHGGDAGGLELARLAAARID